MSKTHFEECFERICAGVAQSTEGAKKPRTQEDMAELLGIRQSSISDAKRRDSIPPEWLVTLQLQYDLNPRWVLTGHSDMFTVPSVERGKVVMREEIKRIEDGAKVKAELDLRDKILGRLARGCGITLDLLSEGARVEVRVQPEWRKEA